MGEGGGAETGARNLEAGICPAWEFRRGCAPFVGILQGGQPPCRSRRGRFQSRACDGRKAYLKPYVDRPSGEPAGQRLVAAADRQLQQKRS